MDMIYFLVGEGSKAKFYIREFVYILSNGGFQYSQDTEKYHRCCFHHADIEC